MDYIVSFSSTVCPFLHGSIITHTISHFPLSHPLHFTRISLPSFPSPRYDLFFPSNHAFLLMPNDNMLFPTLMKHYIEGGNI